MVAASPALKLALGYTLDPIAGQTDAAMEILARLVDLNRAAMRGRWSTYIPYLVVATTKAREAAMKYCPECGSEYQNVVTRCSDCEVDLVTEAEMRQRGLPLPDEKDKRTFVQADTTEDPLTANRFVSLLKDAQIEAFSRPQFGGTVDIITGPSGPWWEILVLEADLPKATELLKEERARIEAQADDASRAAEEEAELSGSDTTS